MPRLPASARTCAWVLEIVVPLSIKTSPVLGSTTSPQAMRPSSLVGRLGIGRVDVFDFVKSLKDGLVARILRAHRTQQGHRRELARLVDPNAQSVFLGDLELDPTAALGDDPAGMQFLVARLDLDDEIDAGGAVELADDDSLGTVDDELAAADHDGHITQVDRFLEGGLTLVEPEPDVERPAVGQA